MALVHLALASRLEGAFISNPRNAPVNRKIGDAEGPRAPFAPPIRDTLRPQEFIARVGKVRMQDAAHTRLDRRQLPEMAALAIANPDIIVDSGTGVGEIVGKPAKGLLINVFCA